jgi:hypothetical protein
MNGFSCGSPKRTHGKSARGRSAEGGSKEACNDWRTSVVAEAPSKPTVDAEQRRHPFPTRPARAKLTRLHRLNRPRRCQATRKSKPASDQPWQWSIAKGRPSRGRAVCRRPSPKRPSPPRQPVPAPPRPWLHYCTCQLCSALRDPCFCWAKVQARLAYSGARGVLCSGCSVLLLYLL